MNRTIKEIMKSILLVSALLFMGWIGYSYRGPMPREGNSSIVPKDLIPAFIPIVFLWICYKVYELNKRVGNLENKQEELKKKIVCLHKLLLNYP